MRRGKSVLDRNPGGTVAAEESSFSSGQEVCFCKEEFFFFMQQCRNVTENKGRPWKAQRGSGNVYENKGDASRKAGMLLKINGLAVISHHAEILFGAGRREGHDDASLSFR
jgi:hypothetical protein